MMSRYRGVFIPKSKEQELKQLKFALRYLADGWEQATSDTEIWQEHARTLRSLTRQIEALEAGASEDEIRAAVLSARQQASEEAES